MAVAEIATNQRVQGGGAYYIISRSFGLNIGGAIGITLYLSQAISVAFYIIAFAEAFDPVIQYLDSSWGIVITDKRLISLPVMAILSLIVLTRGANMGMKALYFVVALLLTSLIMFFIGTPDNMPEQVNFTARVDNPEPFFYVFTIIFPAFTGLAAGLGLSGDLKDPKRSIPLGTILATIAGFFIYIAVGLKLTISANPEDLAGDQLFMQQIAIWGPIIPIGLASAALSSAIGSILVAPRTLQAIGIDNIFPNKFLNQWFGKGKAGSNEPVNSTLLSVIIAFFFIIIGDINFVAEIISMFFMVTYGAICLISFLEHFAADPSYRPTFKSKWYFSATGAILSVWVMFKMNTGYAVLSLLIMAIIYVIISASSDEKKGFSELFKGVLFQLSRQLQVLAQRTSGNGTHNSHWRPFVVCISADSFKRRAAFDMLRWISYKYGFGTYIHYIPGFLTPETNDESKDSLERLLNLAVGVKNRVYLDTIISPSYTSAIAQVIQLTSISGKVNNMILFEFSNNEPESIQTAIQNYNLLETTEFDVCILNTSYKGYGYRKEIHIWITSDDYENANLMILLAYIILGHPDWRKGFIKIFAIYPTTDLDKQKKNLLSLIKSGRLPISPNNVQLISSENKEIKQIITSKSCDADLTIIGFRTEMLKKEQIDLFIGYSDVSNILFVSSRQQKEIN